MVKPAKKPRVERKRKTKRVSRPPLRTNVAKKEGSGSANFEELRDDLFREAAKLVAEDPSQRIAILIAPRNSESKLPLQSFGYPSAESVVRQFLKDTDPVPAPPEDAQKKKEEEEDDDEDEDWSKYYWWEDEKLLNSKDPVEIMAAMAEMEKLRKQIDMYKSETGQSSGTQDDDGSKP